MEIINLLEFRVKNNLFGIKTDYIRTTFDIEKVKPVISMPDYVAGITFVGKRAYILICLERLLGLSEKNCTNLVGKTAVVVNISGDLYALVIDEILKIQEIKKTGSDNDIVNFYKDQEEVLEEITPQFLKLKIKIPPLKQQLKQEKEEKKQTKNTVERSFLVFELNGYLFAIDTEYVKKVEYIENVEKSLTSEDNLVEGVFLVKDTPIKAINLKNVFNMEKKNEESLIVIEKNGKNFALMVDKILDIVSIADEKINKGENENTLLKDFFIYKNSIVSIISDRYVHEFLDKYSLRKTKSEEVEKSKKTLEKEFLIVDILGKDFAIPMEFLSEVAEFDEVHMSVYPSENDYIKGLGTFREKSFFIFTLEKLLNKSFNEGEESKIVILEKDSRFAALIVSNIKDILLVPIDKVANIEGNNFIVGGAVLGKNEEILDIINIDWLLKERTKNV